MKINRAAPIERHIASQEFSKALSLAESWAAESATNPNAKYLCAVALIALGKFTAAISPLKQVLLLKPNMPEAHNNLGIAYKECGDVAAAECHYRQAVELKPNFAEAWGNLAILSMERGKTDEALVLLEKALSYDPKSPIVRLNIGIAYAAIGEYNKSVDFLEQSIGALPLNSEAHANLAHVLLTFGEFSAAWPEYEWRAERRGTLKTPPKMPSLAELSGKNVRVTMEQGYGDLLQMSRYIPLLEQSAGEVLFEVPPLMTSLFEDGWPIKNKDFVHDFVIPNMSLPLLFNTTLETVPALTRPLSITPKIRKKWKNIIDSHAHRADAVKIGIAWAGSKTHRNDRNRSCSLVDFEPLYRIDGVHLFSLQVGEPAGQILDSKWESIVDLGNSINDFSDTAAAISELDLIVSVDTSIVHLAGTLGKDVWTVLPKAPDWRWMLDRDDSIWYPSLRIFRQKTSGDWTELMLRVGAEAHNFVKRQLNKFDSAKTEIEAQLQNKELSQAIQNSRQIAELLSNDLYVLNEIGVLFWNYGFPELALEFFNMALAYDTDDRTTILNSYDVFNFYGLRDDAHLLVSNYLRSHPNDVQVHKLTHPKAIAA